MIEYLFNAVIATAAQDITISAKITDTTNDINNYHLNFFGKDGELIGTYEGKNVEGIWEFTIPATATLGLKGRYWYCLCDKSHYKLNFKQPLYLK